MASSVATVRAGADARLVRLNRTVACLSGAVLLGSSLALAVPTPSPSPPPAAWEKTVTTRPRGSFPNPRPLVATYKFGWSELVAATAEIALSDHDRQIIQLKGNGGTIGLVRMLWKFDTHQRAVADAKTLRPISMHQVDERRHKTVVTDLSFTPGRVERLRSDSSSKKLPETKDFEFPGGLFDLFSALLYIRSQPLRDGDIYRVVVYPATNAYVATLTVVEHAPITVEAGEYPAIKLDVALKKVGKNRELEPHKKFRQASVWVSDDPDRLLLRIEASIFVGSVFAELQSVRFPGQTVARLSSPNDTGSTPRDKSVGRSTAAAVGE